MTRTCPNCRSPVRDQARFCNQCGQALPASNLGTGLLPPNAVLSNRYIILNKVGQGGMGAVYQAADMRIQGKIWALKELSDAAITDPLDKQQAIQGFRREAQLLSQLAHPNIPRVTDFFDEGGKQYLVMEFVEGETLEEVIDATSGPLDEGRVLGWIGQVCDVLTYLHSQQPPIIFRDLKPANVMLDRQGQIKLIDFGIVRHFKPGQTSDTVPMGTPGYAAPEAYGVAQTDPRSDVYSLGAMLHALLTRQDPGLSPFDFHPARDLNPAVSPHVERAIERATQIDPAHRYQSTAEMKQDLFRAMPQQAQTPARQPVPVPGPAQSALQLPPSHTGSTWQAPISARPASPQGHSQISPTRPVPRPAPSGATGPTVATGRPSSPPFSSAWGKGRNLLLLVGIGVGLCLALALIVGGLSGGGGTPYVPSHTPAPSISPRPSNGKVPSPVPSVPSPVTVSEATPTSPGQPPTRTPVPRPTATWTPKPTATWTPKPTPTPVPACAFAAQGKFAGLWQTYRDRLGCPLQQRPQTIQDAEQSFQNGHMLWRMDNRQIYVIYEQGTRTGTFEAFSDRWSEGDPEYSCPASPPPSLVQPKRGFGVVWCQLGAARAPIGWGLGQEAGFSPGNGDPLAQDFERGTILRDSDGKSRGMAYVLFRDGTFVRVPY